MPGASDVRGFFTSSNFGRLNNSGRLNPGRAGLVFEGAAGARPTAPGPRESPACSARDSHTPPPRVGPLRGTGSPPGGPAAPTGDLGRLNSGFRSVEYPWRRDAGRSKIRPDPAVRKFPKLRVTCAKTIGCTNVEKPTVFNIGLFAGRLRRPRIFHQFEFRAVE